MPVSYIPCIIPVLLIVIPMIFLSKGKKPFLKASCVSIAIFLILILRVYVPGWLLMYKADRGDAIAQYELSRWYATHNQSINEWMLWPYDSEVTTMHSFTWLEKSAEQQYPIALYALGVHYKCGFGVPEPIGWDGPSGNVFPQPVKGQKLIDLAIKLNYKPKVREELFIRTVYLVYE